MWWKRKKIVPLFPEVNATMEAMRTKDPELALSVFDLPITAGMELWCETYPEDFPEGGMGLPGPHNIMPKQENGNDPRGED